jgi:hypothetical protein
MLFAGKWMNEYHHVEQDKSHSKFKISYGFAAMWNLDLQ